MRYVTDFYEVPRERTGEGSRASPTNAVRSTRWTSTATPRHEDSEPFLGALLAYLDENGILATQAPEHEDLLMDLVEFHGGGWDLVDPRPGLADLLDAARFDEAVLRRFYEGEDDECPEAGFAMLQYLDPLRQAFDGLSAGSVLLVRQH